MAALADSDIKVYLTGAGSDGGAQAVPSASLGNFRSSTVFVNDSDLNLFRAATYAEATASEDYYLSLCFKNENGAGENAIAMKFWWALPATTTETVGYAASGAISITPANMAEFDTDCGYAYNVTKNEIVFYTSTTPTTLVVPATGRGLRSTSAAIGAIADVIRPFPWADFCTETNAVTPDTGAIQTIGAITTAPTLGVNTSGAWSKVSAYDDATGYAGGVGINNNSYGADLLDGKICFVWFKWIVPALTPRNASFDLSWIKWGCEN